MGYLNNQVITVDAILTTKGRELLAKGDGSFNITQFALADDEIDYTLYNPTNPSGSAYYGEAIENMPLLEAFPDEMQMMKYKLVTLPRDTAKMPTLAIGNANPVIAQTEPYVVKVNTLNYLGGNSVVESSGYVFTVSDVRMFSSVIATGIDNKASLQLNATQTNGTNVSKTVIGTSVTLTATGINTLFGTARNALYGTLTITGRDSGARLQVPITIRRTS
jgi:hypothetical protein|tara:strand:- start:698 stop:1357 length:660 start_codon:yes stop_codon:yes gene_type:complete